LHEREPDGVGTWTATGERTASLTIVYHDVDEALTLRGTIIIRAAAEVSADGDSFTAPYTADFVAPDGTSGGEIGPATAVGTRIVVEPMGTPEAGASAGESIGSVSVSAWTCGPDVDLSNPDPATLSTACTRPLDGAVFSLESGAVARRRVAEAGRAAEWPAVAGPFTLRQEEPSPGDAIVVCGGIAGLIVDTAPGGVFRGEVARDERLTCDWYALGTSSLASPEAGSGGATGIVIASVVAEDGVTPVGGACLHLAGPATYAVCDDAEGDADPVPGTIEVDGVAAGDYAMAIQPPAGYAPTEDVPAQIHVEAGGVRSLSVMVRE
ncbi:MAG: hypothetical protein QOF01_3046, partial [Thermomicrobiales bacterium]|nr:hypothetical protein [Thermomicrobiales bacterium]